MSVRQTSVESLTLGDPDHRLIFGKTQIRAKGLEKTT